MNPGQSLPKFELWHELPVTTPLNGMPFAVTTAPGCQPARRSIVIPRKLYVEAVVEGWVVGLLLTALGAVVRVLGEAAAEVGGVEPAGTLGVLPLFAEA